GVAPIPEIMHPLVALGLEMKYLRELTDRTAKAVFAEAGDSVDYLVGTMVELPRAALRAADLAEYAEFFSFGTNDLTQTTFGISRDDSGRFLQVYLDKGIFENDPFVRLDQNGVGDLIRIADQRGRAAKPGLKMGICGEHGGDPSSLAFCEEVGLDYVSCSPYRVPNARLAAAQAALAARSGVEREKDREGSGWRLSLTVSGRVVAQRPGGEGRVILHSALNSLAAPTPLRLRLSHP